MIKLSFFNFNCIKENEADQRNIKGSISSFFNSLCLSSILSPLALSTLLSSYQQICKTNWVACTQYPPQLWDAQWENESFGGIIGNVPLLGLSGLPAGFAHLCWHARLANSDFNDCRIRLLFSHKWGEKNNLMVKLEGNNVIFSGSEVLNETCWHLFLHKKYCCNTSYKTKLI